MTSFSAISMSSDEHQFNIVFSIKGQVYYKVGSLSPLQNGISLAKWIKCVDFPVPRYPIEEHQECAAKVEKYNFQWKCLHQNYFVTKWTNSGTT
ncbi:hypothetical protein CEXT_602281 [Caerostris extrusa]|uniref:Uncharacterized protein n=1 Tax=Caerostris extrusa TaxID=172846 RepID=A0AAV4MT65_CAEEX|nr:hypothetical protein CEXT_602281 [Caerostris extrusa]